MSAATAGRPEMAAAPTLLHLSDPHFGTERAQVVEALLRWAAARQAASVVVISGDISQRGRRGQFGRARQFIARLRALWPQAAVLVLPGNHDIPLFDLRARLLAPFAGFRRAFGHELEPCHDDADFQIQLVNTSTPWLHKDGRVRAQQVKRVAQRLRQARPGQLRVVVTHQPVAVLRAEDERDLLRGAAPALHSWAEAGAQLLLGGHIHLPYVLALRPGGSHARKLWVVQAGTAVSSRVRNEAGNSFNYLRYRRGAAPVAEVERWDYAEARGGFELGQWRELDLAPP